VDKVESAERIIKADAGTIFAVLADPSRHRDIDGSGSVRDAAESSPSRLTLGATFGMNMRIGVPYRMTNTVVEFETDRRIAWSHVGGHVWRYVLEPLDGGTRVTEEFDWRTSKAPLFLRLTRAPARNRASLVKTLERLDALVTAR
jgi:hypothetical protein